MPEYRQGEEKIDYQTHEIHEYEYYFIFRVVGVFRG